MSEQQHAKIGGPICHSDLVQVLFEMNTLPEQEHFDFWDFVSCSKCRMPFSTENRTATVPFWLTECGHIVCNNHLNPDQSCAQCGSTGIQLTPLQREMEAPMSEWFQSIPARLDSVVFATKFQQEILASQVQFHKSRHQQLRLLLERLKREVLDLKRDNDILRRENDQYRLKNGYAPEQQILSDIPNSNNKRQMFPVQQYSYADKRPRTGLSADSAIAGASGPRRLTLQPGQSHPEPLTYKSPDQRMRNSDSMTRSYDVPQMTLPSRPEHAYVSKRPSTVRSLEQYAYMPPQSRDTQPRQPFYPHNSTNMNHNAAAVDLSQHSNQASSSSTGNQLAPLSSSRFKPVRNMAPPPTPQQPRATMSDSSNKTVNHLSTQVGKHWPVPSTPASSFQQRNTNTVSHRPFDLGEPRPLPTAGHRTPFVSKNRSGQENVFRPVR